MRTLAFLYRNSPAYKEPTLCGKMKRLTFRKVTGQGNLLTSRIKKWFALSSTLLL